MLRVVSIKVALVTPGTYLVCILFVVLDRLELVNYVLYSCKQLMSMSGLLNCIH